MAEQDHPAGIPASPADLQPGGHTAVEAVLRAVLVCDLVASTELVEELGDRRAAELFERHDRLARDLMERHGGLEIDKTDGFLVLFERPVHALELALAYHRGLRELGDAIGRPLRARVGIHLGEVFLRRNPERDVARGAKPLEVEGLAKAMAARLAALALPGQTLLTRGAYDLAQRATLDTLPPGLQWMGHGDYRLKGFPEPVAVFEIGRQGESPLAPPPAPSAGGVTAPGRGRLAARWAAPAILLLLVASSLLFLRARQPDLQLGPDDWVLFTGVENRTGEALLDGSLDVALRMALDRGRAFKVVPPHRVRELLEQLGRDPEGWIDRETGVALARAQNARALVAAQVHRSSEEYRLATELVDVARGRTVARKTEAVTDHEGLLPAVARLGAGLRDLLGAPPEIDGPEVWLPSTATESLPALKAFALGVERSDQARGDEAVELLHRSLRLDPDFAIAHAKLGTIYQFLLGDTRRAIEHWRHALELGERLPERERLYVEGSLAWRGSPVEMRRIWRLMADLYPLDPAGHGNLGFVEWWYLGDFPAARQAWERATSIEPGMARNFHNLGYLQIGTGEPEAALRSFETALRIDPYPMSGGKADALVALGRYGEALEYLEATRSVRVDTQPYYPFERLMLLVTLHVDQGQLEDALAAARWALGIAEQRKHLTSKLRALAAQAAIFEARGEEGRLGETLTRALGLALDGLAGESKPLTALPVSQTALLAKVAARSGHIELADSALSALRPVVEEHGVPYWRAYLSVAEAELDLARHDPSSAVEKLHVALALADLFQGHETLARAFEALGDGRRAASELSWLRHHRGRAFAEWIDWFFGRELHLLGWAAASYHLGRLAEANGDDEEARAHYQALLDQWRHGDETPLLAAARQRASAGER